ncbi:hypothetical protein ACLB2K_045552 [Fragaria x ananassa]
MQIFISCRSEEVISFGVVRSWKLMGEWKFRETIKMKKKKGSSSPSRTRLHAWTCFGPTTHQEERDQNKEITCAPVTRVFEYGGVCRVLWSKDLDSRNTR